jgi:Uma2 family endonuclease
MTSAVFSDGRPMSETEFLALGETPDRIELFDGSLFVTPAATPLHQRISGKLFTALDATAEQAGLIVAEAVNVRLRPGRIPIPDLVITTEIDMRDPIIDGSAVMLVCEIISPSNAAADKVTKMYYYAAAGIPWYLLVDPDARALHLYELTGATYTEQSVAKPGEILELTQPVAVTLDPARLIPAG